MKILCCQIDVDGVTRRSTMQAQQERVKELIRSACANQTIDLVLLPELSAIEYSTHAFDNLAELATGMDGWLVESMCALAQQLNTAICFGMPRKGRRGYYISQVLVNREGAVKTHYDKLHLAQLGASTEKAYFTPGNHVTVVELNSYRIGIVICYDMRFGEYISKMVRDHQIDIMLHPVAFCRDGTFASWRSFACTRALENQVYWLSLNRAGRGWGHSILCPPWFEQQSEVIELDETETLKVFEIDKKSLQQTEEKYPLKPDRLNDYSSVVRTLHYTT